METVHNSVGLRRLLQACVVLFNIYPRMLRDMIANNVSPEQLDEMIQKAGKNFKKTFNSAESLIVDNIRTEGFSKMDGSLLYKLIRHFELVEKPSAGWEKNPKEGAIRQGDDVQNLRNLRNSIFHRFSPTLTEQESECFFSVFLQCADRLDRYLQRPKMVFTEDIMRVKFLDDSILLPYNKQFEDTEKMQAEASWENGNHTITLYYKKTLREEIGNNENKKDGPKDYIMEIVGEENPDKVVEMLQQWIGSINHRGCKIMLKSAGKGCVVLLISIDYMTFASILALQEQIQLFVNRILGITDVRKWMKKDLRIMLIPIDFISSTVSEPDYTMQCEKCQAKLKPGAQFCHECGYKIDMKIFCTSCEHTVMEEHNFCPNCGYQRRQASGTECTMLCKNCKGTLQTDMKFCHICRWKIDKKLFCPICYCVVVEEINFCSNCGMKLKKDPDELEMTAGHNDDQNVQAQGSIKDSDTLDQPVDFNVDEMFKAQSAIIEPESLKEVEQLMKRIEVEGSDKLMIHLNNTLNKWKGENIKFGVTGASAMGKSSFINLFIDFNDVNTRRAKTSFYGNTTLSPTEYAAATQKNVSFIDCPGYGTTAFESSEYIEKMTVGTFDYVLIFYSVINSIDISFAKILNKKQKNFCFVRTKLDNDIENSKFDNPEDNNPDSIASKLRETAIKVIENKGLLNPTVFVISNRSTELGDFRKLLSHIEKVLHKSKYEAFIFEISAFTREVIDRKHEMLCKRINTVSVVGVTEEAEDAIHYDFKNEDNSDKRIVRRLADEIKFYIETFELTKNTSIELIRKEHVRNKLKFPCNLTSDVENNVIFFIKEKFRIQKKDELVVAYKKDTGKVDDSKELTMCLTSSRNILSEALDWLRDDALVIFEEFTFRSLKK